MKLSKKNDEDCLGVLFSRFEADFVAEKNYNDRNSSNRWEVCWRCAGVFKSLSQHFCKSVLSYKSFSHVARWLLIPNNLAQCFTYWSIKKVKRYKNKNKNFGYGKDFET